MQEILDNFTILNDFINLKIILIDMDSYRYYNNELLERYQKWKNVPWSSLIKWSVKLSEKKDWLAPLLLLTGGISNFLPLKTFDNSPCILYFEATSVYTASRAVLVLPPCTAYHTETYYRNNFRVYVCKKEKKTILIDIIHKFWHYHIF